MTPEIEQLKNEIKALREEINLLKNAYSIPQDVDGAFRERFKLDDFAQLSASTKNASTETQAVAEGGSASYSVAKPMDGFFEFVSGSTAYYIPYYEL